MFNPSVLRTPPLIFIGHKTKGININEAGRVV
nr:MAG TPA_asm: hypothetical protein [Caudoviricetes sp.]